MITIRWIFLRNYSIAVWSKGRNTSYQLPETRIVRNHLLVKWTSRLKNHNGVQSEHRVWWRLFDLRDQKTRFFARARRFDQHELLVHEFHPSKTLSVVISNWWIRSLRTFEFYHTCEDCSTPVFLELSFVHVISLNTFFRSKLKRQLYFLVFWNDRKFGCIT